MQRIVRVVVLVGLMLGCTAILPAASLSLSSNNLSWNPAVSALSPSVLISVLNSQTVNDPDLLTGWQLNLMLQPQAGATGTLRFNSATLPTSGYLLEGNSAGLVATINAGGTGLTAFDDDESIPLGVAVPASGKSLLSLDFRTLNNAAGTFNLLAVAPPGGFTQWGDTAPNDRYFTNVPLGGTAPVVLATITLVPEPSTLALSGLAALMLAANLGRQIRRSRCSKAAD